MSTIVKCSTRIHDEIKIFIFYCYTNRVSYTHIHTLGRELPYYVWMRVYYLSSIYYAIFYSFSQLAWLVFISFAHRIPFQFSSRASSRCSVLSLSRCECVCVYNVYAHLLELIFWIEIYLLLESARAWAQLLLCANQRKTERRQKEIKRNSDYDGSGSSDWNDHS